ncbi:MAG: ABC transporter ATP-binding protein [Candidatus Aminicenantes bacterium]|nr:ABC transporter ATP-binding protein [Candidatus Aminicenantes bacterium]
MSTVLEVRNLHKTFTTGFIPQKKKILKGITFKVEEGEIFGYLGPNGAGKTTTLKCILGIIFPNKGEIRLFGLPHTSLQAKAKIGFLPENPYFYEYLTAAEFLRFYAQLFGLPRDKREKKIDQLLQLVGLEKAAATQLRKFSRGMLQRIGLAQALINDPSLVFLDEPLGGLDPLGRKEMRDIILRLREEGKTVFLCSHILQDIEMVCDRVAIIVDGKILNQGKLQNLVSEKILFYEVVVSGVPASSFTPLGECLAEDGGRLLLKITAEENIKKVIKIVLEREGRLHSLTPRTATLEDLFVDLVKQR